ncbi:MAG: hypothetical protein U9N62_13685 [Thermotogota bacterium]|nr:hypothetical protein [Thermotogota bacterium]
MLMKQITAIVCLIILAGLVFADELSHIVSTIDLVINQDIVSNIDVIEKEGVVFVNHLTFSQVFHSRVLPVVYSKAFFHTAFRIIG